MANNSRKVPPSPYQGEADFHDVFYDTAADHIYASYAYSLVKQRNTDFVLRNIADPTTKTVISLGCGNGAFECSLSPHFQQIIGVDLSTRAIELARQRQVERGLTNLTFRVGNARTIDAPDQSVDAILVISTFHHLSEDDLANLMREAYRVLRPGGVILSVDPNYYRLLGLFKFLVTKTFARYHSPDERVIPPALIRTHLAANGFRAIRIEWLDFFYNPLCWVFPGMKKPLANLLSRLDKIVISVPILRRLGNAFGVVGRKC